MRSVVVLPQPLGPSRVKNSPSSISRLRSSTARTCLPKILVTPLRRRAILLIGSLLRDAWERTRAACPPRSGRDETGRLGQ